MLLTEIDHVAIAVSDLDAAIDYYERAFGATVAHAWIKRSALKNGVRPKWAEGLFSVSQAGGRGFEPHRPLRKAPRALGAQRASHHDQTRERRRSR